MPRNSFGALAWWFIRENLLTLKLNYMRKLKKFLPSFCKKKRHILFHRYKVRIYQPREVTSFRCFRLKNVTATYTTPIDYYTLDGYEKEVVLKNKHVKALIVETITKTAIYV